MDSMLDVMLMNNVLDTMNFLFTGSGLITLLIITFLIIVMWYYFYKKAQPIKEVSKNA
jgi:hypothetical protein